MAMTDDERTAFIAAMALTAEECMALADVNDKLYIAQALDQMSDQMKQVAAAMVQSEAKDQGKTPEEICPCPDCVAVRNSGHAAKNN